MAKRESLIDAYIYIDPHILREDTNPTPGMEWPAFRRKLYVDDKAKSHGWLVSCKSGRMKLNRL